MLVLGFFSGVVVKNQMDYQQKRLKFSCPESALKAPATIVQARIAIGSGGVLGRIFSGTQSRLGSCPSAIPTLSWPSWARKWGSGTMLVMAFTSWSRPDTPVRQLARDRFGYLVNCGIFGMLMVYFCINFGMLLGLSPVAGVPLPLVSYGGSNLVATLIAIGLVQSIYARRYALV